MAVENGEWIMYGLPENHPDRIRSVEELLSYIEKVGFLPLFKNEIPGFSVEERTYAKDWWSGDPKKDPWEWRGLAAESARVAYGKFFGNKAGFVAKEWLPYFVNYRRDGYDFDALWEDEKASLRQKKLMDHFTPETEIFSYELKQKAGFGKGGEKNFEGTVADLQMQTYLCVSKFRQKKNKKGQEYGWSIALYCMPEHLWGYDFVTSAYSEKPEESRNRIFKQVKECFPDAEEGTMRKVLGIGTDTKSKKS